MKISLQSFYSTFYGKEFARYYRRIGYKDNPHLRKQFIAKTPQNIIGHIQKADNNYHSYLSIYNYTNIESLKERSTKNLIVDRLFFDFDASNQEYKKTKHALINILSDGLYKRPIEQQNIKDKLKNLILDEKIAKKSIEESQSFASKIESEFGNPPALFFSGSKGAHAYIFFRPVDLKDPKKTIWHFSKRIKELFNYETMDLSVNKNALTRVARVPYSVNPLTNLRMVPFSVKDDYEDITLKSIEYSVEKFNVFNHLTDLDEHLKQIDTILTNNKKIKSYRSKRTKKSFNACDWKKINHIQFFKDFIGEPTKKYDNYVMYHCPFPGHEDKKPSFLVHKSGYLCYGCNKKGNFWQFLKDFNCWDDKKVRSYLTRKKES